MENLQSNIPMINQLMCGEFDDILDDISIALVSRRKSIVDSAEKIVVGDRVVVAGGTVPRLIGEAGVVTDIRGDTIFVDLDNKGKLGYYGSGPINGKAKSFKKI